jgi:hypothetical protein
VENFEMISKREGRRKIEKDEREGIEKEIK